MLFLTELLAQPYINGIGSLNQWPSFLCTINCKLLNCHYNSKLHSCPKSLIFALH